MRPPPPYLAKTIAALCLLSSGPQAIHFNLLIQPQNQVRQFINESYTNRHNSTLSKLQISTIYGLLAATAFFCGFVGIFLSYQIIDRIGRKIILFRVRGSANLCASVMGLVAWYTRLYELLFVSRILYGIDWGFSVTTASIYLSEIAPPKHRGKISQIQQTSSLTVGVLVYILGIPPLLGGPDRWHWIFVVPMIPAILQLIAYFYVPESPKHLYINEGRIEETREIVSKLNGASKNAVDEILAKYDKEAKQAALRSTLKQVLLTPHLRTSLLLAMSLGIMRVSSGGLIFNQYAKILFTDELGATEDTASYIVVGTGLLTVLCTNVAICLIDRVGRRKLVLTGLVLVCLLGVVYTILGAVPQQDWFKYLQIILVVAIQCVFPICLMAPSVHMANELTPHSAKPVISSVGNFAGVIARMAYFFGFPVLQDVIGVYSVLLLIVIPNVIIFAYFFFELPETKRRSIDDIVAEIMERKSKGKHKEMNGHSQTEKEGEIMYTRF